MSLFSSIELLAPDPIFGLMAAFESDDRAEKINLGIGTYRDGEGKSCVFRAVREAEAILLEMKLSKAYLPIAGDREFIEDVLRLSLGPSYDAERTFALQSVGGTGALSLASDLIAQSGGHDVYLSSPTWPNHMKIFTKGGHKTHEYPYYDPSTKKISFDRMISALDNMAPHSVIVLHASCHNPTGMDPTPEEWKEISHRIKKRAIIPVFDMAYQGFGDGLEADAHAVRLFMQEGHEMFLAISLSKNFGLYGERAGVLAFIGEDHKIARCVGSHLEYLARATYSNPPCHAPRLVKTILASDRLRSLWLEELNEMRQRILSMRFALLHGLEALGGDKDFSYLVQQRGMFGFSGLNSDQVKALRQDQAIFMTASGRINIAGLNAHNIDAVVRAIHSAFYGKNKP